MRRAARAPSTILAKATILRGYELLAVIEKAPGSPTSYQYLVMSALRASALDRGGEDVAFLERLVAK